ncbi:MAG: hypothetical protein U0K65_01455 [Negativibacillus sp.]|nr:hypothetical protein [Negativibacillus sp.]
MKWENTHQYSRQELEDMQQNALERVRQMQRRSEQMLHHTKRPPSFFIEEPQSTPVPLPPSPSCDVKPLPPPKPHGKAAKAEPAPPKENGLESLFSALDLDRERLLILGLFFLLYSDGADPSLLLALLFLAM